MDGYPQSTAQAEVGGYLDSGSEALQRFLQDRQDGLVWLGHASFLIRLHGKTLLVDPVLFDLAPMLRRRHALPCRPGDLKGIDAILLSHGHRDHLDIPTLSLLLEHNPDIVVLCPLGFEKMLRNIGFRHVQEAAWWQQYTMVKGLDIIFLPARHWNRRWLWDFNTTLWGVSGYNMGNEVSTLPGIPPIPPISRPYAVKWAHRRYA